MEMEDESRSAPAGFNPLHCGAVVASVEYWVGGDAPEYEFQSPSLRGSGRFESVTDR